MRFGLLLSSLKLKDVAQRKKDRETQTRSADPTLALWGGPALSVRVALRWTMAGPCPCYCEIHSQPSSLNSAPPRKGAGFGFSVLWGLGETTSNDFNVVAATSSIYMVTWSKSQSSVRICLAVPSSTLFLGVSSPAFARSGVVDGQEVAA